MALPIPNVLHKPADLPKGFVTALFQPEIATGVWSTLETSQVAIPNISLQVPLPNKCDMAARVAECFEGPRREELTSLLYNFSHLFYVYGCPISIASLVFKREQYSKTALQHYTAKRAPKTRNFFNTMSNIQEVKKPRGYFPHKTMPMILLQFSWDIPVQSLSTTETHKWSVGHKFWFRSTRSCNT